MQSGVDRRGYAALYRVPLCIWISYRGLTSNSTSERNWYFHGSLGPRYLGDIDVVLWGNGEQMIACAAYGRRIARKSTVLVMQIETLSKYSYF